MSTRRRARVALGDASEDARGVNPLSALMTYGGDDDDDDDDDDDKGDGDAQRADAKTSRDASLPPGWHAAVDATHNKVYYYNKRTKESSWTAPTWVGGESESRGGAEAEAPPPPTTTTTVTDDAAEENLVVEARMDARENDGSDDDSYALDADTLRVRVLEAMETMEARCPDVAARALATPDVVFLYRELSDIERSCRSQNDSRVLRAFDDRLSVVQGALNDAVVAYKEWTTEAAVDDDGDVVRADEVPDPPPVPKGSIISAPPAPPLPKDTWSVPTQKSTAPALKKQKMAAMSNTKAHKGDMSKWAKVREAEDEALDGTKAAAAIEAKRARELEAWRADKIRAGVDATANPNFVPVGDWRSRVEAAKKRDRLEAFRAREDDAPGDGKTTDGKSDAVNAKNTSDDGSEKPLPPGWRAFFDDVSGDVYYGNLETKETCWDPPEA